MKALIIGSGGREHAIAEALLRSPQVTDVIMAGTSGAEAEGLRVLPLDTADPEGLADFAEKEKIDLTVVGPEAALATGVADVFHRRGLKIFGPEKKAAELEGSKEFAKRFMKKYGVPTADYVEASSYEEAKAHTGVFGFPEVIKADGLCAGKGVYICPDAAAAEQALREIFLEEKFGDNGGRVVIEQFLKGPEASLLCFVSGTKIYPMVTAMDYKKAHDGDEGPNTGGMGALSPNPWWNGDLEAQSTEILHRIEAGLEAEGLGYSGILFVGYIIADGKLQVLEFNTRFGDPETEAVLPKLTSDLYENMMQSIREEEVTLSWDDKKAVAVILASCGYPASYEKGYAIEGLEDLEPEITVFHNGTRRTEDGLLTNGGRVLTLMTKADSFEEARERVYRNRENVRSENLEGRRDIGLL